MTNAIWVTSTKFYISTSTLKHKLLTHFCYHITFDSGLRTV